MAAAACRPSEHSATTWKRGSSSKKDRIFLRPRTSSSTMMVRSIGEHAPFLSGFAPFGRNMYLHLPTAPAAVGVVEPLGVAVVFLEPRAGVGQTDPFPRG